MTVLAAEGVAFDAHVPLAIVGGGACGMTAALAARDAGVPALVLERDAVPQGSTALSSGMIPAAGTAIQRAAGVEDSAEMFARDILAKARGETDAGMVRAVAGASGGVIDWLTEAHGVELTLVEGFLYPGHSAPRMHAPPSRAGADLIGALTGAAERAGADIVTGAHVTAIYADPDGRVRGLGVERPGGVSERLGCDALVLACNGYGGNPDMLAELIPEMAGALYFGHAGNQGDALNWGRALGAAAADLGGFQGHGSVAHPEGILVSWALMMEGGIQVNAEGRRFSNEHDGYSEQARRVIAQPGGVAWNIYDDRLHALAQDLEDYRKLEASGAIRTGATAVGLAAATGLPADALEATRADCARMAVGEGRDPFGRDFTKSPPLVPPWRAVRVTGALFHTQGGLVVDARARVLRADGTPLPNLWAGGGAARGLSGPSDWGYLSGNGLLTAVVLGAAAGRDAGARLGGRP